MHAYVFNLIARRPYFSLSVLLKVATFAAVGCHGSS